MPKNSLFTAFSLLLEDLRGAAQLQMQLLDQEAQHAGQTLALMLGFGMVAGLLLFTAWIGLCAAGVLWLVQLNCNVIVALLVAVLLNVAGGVALGFAMRRKARVLSFPATKQNLGSGVLLFLAWRKLRRAAGI